MNETGLNVDMMTYSGRNWKAKNAPPLNLPVMLSDQLWFLGWENTFRANE